MRSQTGGLVAVFNCFQCSVGKFDQQQLRRHAKVPLYLAVYRAAPLAAELTTFITSEAGIAQALSQPLELLSKICNRTGSQLAKVGGWVAEASSNILQHAVAHHMTTHSANPVHNFLRQQTPASLGNSNASWRPAGTDVVLVIDAEQQQPPQAQQQQEPPLSPLGAGPPVAVGEFMKPTILACPAGPDEWTPVDLVEGFRKKDPKAVRVVCQVSYDQALAVSLHTEHLRLPVGCYNMTSRLLWA